MRWSHASVRFGFAAFAASTSLFVACLLPSFSDVLPEPGSDAQPADAGEEGDGSLAGCDDTSGAFVVWPMTEGSGTTIRDCSGKYTGTFGAGVAWTTGRSGLPALQFSGGVLTIVDAPELRIVGPFTVAAWVEPATTQTDQFGDVVARYESINAAVWGLAVTKDPQVVFTAFSAPITQASANGLTFGKFTHIVRPVLQRAPRFQIRKRDTGTVGRNDTHTALLCDFVCGRNVESAHETAVIVDNGKSFRRAVFAIAEFASVGEGDECVHIK